MRERCITETCARNSSEEQVFLNQQMSRDFCSERNRFTLECNSGSGTMADSAASMGLCAMRARSQGEWA
jgi:hypothetical protein